MDKLEVSMPIQTILNGSNYILWAQEMSSFLRGRKLWRYVTGNLREPSQAVEEDDDTFAGRLEEWESKNHQILTWFRNTSIPSIKLQFGRLNTAKEAWDLLAGRYSTSDIAHQYQLLGNLHRMRQETGQSINDFLSSMHAIWDQLALYEPTWDSTIDARKFAEYRDRMRVMQFLMALNDEYEPVRASLLHRDPLPHLEVVVSELLTEETRLATLKAQRATPLVSTPIDAVLATSGSSSWHKPYCTHCRRPGHRASNCYQLQSKQPTGTNNRSRFRGAAARRPSTAASVIEDSSTSSSVTLSLDDLRSTVRSILQETGTSSSSTLSVTPGTHDSWFFDSACCNHMTSHSNLFKSKSYNSQAPIIHTADNSQMIVSHTGNVSTPTLSLPDTFMVPNLSLNLISVGQLCELGFDIHFSLNGCRVQDPRTGQTIGTGRKVGRLFELVSLKLPNSFTGCAATVSS